MNEMRLTSQKAEQYHQHFIVGLPDGRKKQEGKKVIFYEIINQKVLAAAPLSPLSRNTQLAKLSSLTCTLCLKKVHLFIFQITLSKINRF